MARIGFGSFGVFWESVHEIDSDSVFEKVGWVGRAFEEVAVLVGESGVVESGSAF